VLLGEISRVGFQGWLRHTVQFLVVGVEIGDRTLLFGCVGVGVLNTHLLLLTFWGFPESFCSSLLDVSARGRPVRLLITRSSATWCGTTRSWFWWHPTGVDLIDSVRLVLRPISLPVARMLFEGGTPRGLRFAPGYPSRFTREVMESVLEARGPGRFGPYFMVRKVDEMIIGEIGCSAGDRSATGKVGYSVVEPCWGQGYATEALRALLDYVLAQPDMRRVVAETMVDHVASRRVMEKAGMTYCGERLDDEYGELINLVVYEAYAQRTVPTR
jgi:RimJ/RimL family protein N-acetyltransferase